MINRKYILLLTAAALLPLAGCLKDPGPSDGGSITVEASIGAQTKVTTVGDGSAFAEGDRIAVYAWTGSASAVPDTRVVNGVVNTLGSSGWTPASEMRWKNLTDAHYFLGVNPVHTISSFTAGEYVLGTDSFAANDLLVATVLGEGRTASGGAVPLGFKHVMARLSVNIQLGNTLSAGDVSGVTVLAKKLAVVDYLAQTASASSSASASELPLFAMSTAASGYALSYSGPQVPQEGVRKITVRVAGMDYVYTSDSDIPLVSGKHTTVNLVVGKDRVELSDVSVSDWVASGTLDGGEAKVVSPFFANNWLTFTSEGTTKLSLLNVAGNAPKLYYSTDTYDWTEWDYSELTFSSGAPLYICGDNPGGFSSSVSKYSKFVVSGNTCSISGDIMSLLAYDKDIKEIPCEYCFCHLFDVCKLLTKAPDLPATTLAPGCYFEMFHGCNRLETAPVLPATRLFDWSYAYMFQGCSNLNYVKCLAEDIDYSKCTYYWLDAVKSSGTFVKASGMNKWTPDSEHGIPSGWAVKDNISASQYLTFTSSGTSTISLSLTYVSSPKLYYSRNAEDWYEWDLSGLTFTYGEPLYLCGDNPGGLCTHYFTFCRFHDEGSDAYEISGSIMSLLNKDAELLVIPNDYCFYSLFQGCTSLTTAPDLPATTLTPDCYGCLFNGCASLKTAPALPATALAAECYFSIFKDCISLSKAPDLPATTLANSCYRNMFAGCTGLTTAPALPATTLTGKCYFHMFQDCTGLTTAPALPATALAENCYGSMFYGCTGLTTAPTLPATALAESCYNSMFMDCTGLKTAPALPATSLAENCYYFMFHGCTSLTTAPALAATTLAENCYGYMFGGCTSLEAAPALPATTLANGCYKAMFRQCSALKASPELPAPVLVEECYYEMFYGCSSLSVVTCLATGLDAEHSRTRWLQDVAGSGTFYQDVAADWDSVLEDGIPSGWTSRFNARALCITTDGEMKVSLDNKGGNTPKLYYSANLSDWTEWDYSELTFSSSAPLYLCGDNTSGFSFSTGKYSQFIFTDLNGNGSKVRVSGDIMSLIDKESERLVIPNDYCFYKLFQDCTSLTTAPALPATTLADHGYANMFHACTSLTTAPALPATTLAAYCYSYMFCGCSNLNKAPVLPATTLAGSCYFCMFKDCNGLATAPALPATTLANGCYSYMFEGCKSLTTAPAVLPAITLANECYKYMFNGCTSLEAAPDLPATGLKDACYYRMFKDCSKLSYVKCLALNPDETNLKQWLLGVAYTGTFVKNDSATSWLEGSSGIPTGWTVLKF